MRKIIITLILAVITVFSLKAQDIQSITNGFPIEIQNVPYQVSIQNKSTGNHFCGGSIINGKYVLTVAHCVRGKNASDITLNVGFSTQNNPGNNLQSYNAKRIVIHPNYNNSTNDFDVAIIEINETFIFNDFVQPVELISNQTLFAETIGNQVRVSGWGWTIPNQSGISNQLQAVDVPIISNQIADGQLDISIPTHPELTQRMLSTGAVGVDRQGACHGDSGGPLVFKQNGQNDIQIGVVSWGVPGCSGEENSPSVYARLSQLVGWVNTEVWNFSNIQGGDIVCYNSSKTFTLQGIPNFINVLNWQVSSNATILSSNDNSVTIRAISPNSIGNAWVRANLSNDVVLRKDFKVGVPAVSRITLESFRSSPIYTGRFTNITARYDWLIDVGQLGYNWEWIVPSSQVRNHGDNISYIHVSPLGNPSSIYIKTRAGNECGCSDWKGKWFTVQTAPGGCTDCPTNGGEIHY